MEIKNISKKIFRNTASNKIKNCNNQTNPFGVSFTGNMGNMIITADVFDTPKKSDISFMSLAATKASKMSKMLSSVTVGSISDLNKTIKAGLNSIMAVGNKVKEKSAAVWNYLNTHNLELNMNIIKKHKSPFVFKIGDGEFEIAKLKNLEPGQLETTLQNLADEKVRIAA